MSAERKKRSKSPVVVGEFKATPLLRGVSRTILGSKVRMLLHLTFLGLLFIEIAIKADGRESQQTRRSPARQRRAGRGCFGQLPFEVRARDQIRLKVLPSSSANRLAKIGAVKLGSSSLIER